MFYKDLKDNLGNLGTVDCNVLEKEEMKDIKYFLLDCLNEYIDNILVPKNKILPYITESWINVTKTGGFHHLHTHPNSFISGVMYISADAEKDKIYFHKKDSLFILDIETDNYIITNSNKWWLPAKPGTLYLFPSLLSHEVVKTDSEHLRVSLSFNTFLKGIISTNYTSRLTLN